MIGFSTTRSRLPSFANNSLLFFSSRRRHTRCYRDWSSDVCSSDLLRRLAQSRRGRAARPPAPGGPARPRAAVALDRHARGLARDLPSARAPCAGRDSGARAARGMSLTYAIVSPVRDEERHLARVASCLAGQVVPPIAWCVVDNGSEDRTLEVARSLAAELPWIRVATAPPGPRQARGAAVVRAFHAGLAA